MMSLASQCTPTPLEIATLCRGKSGTGNSWGAGNLIKSIDSSFTHDADHSSVVVIDDGGTVRRVVAYHHGNEGIAVVVLDNASDMNKHAPNDVLIGGTGSVNWPHLVDDGTSLHLVAYNTSLKEIKYATCNYTTATNNCASDSEWSTQSVDLDFDPTLIEKGKHP